jgi:hypothetical protein
MPKFEDLVKKSDLESYVKIRIRSVAPDKIQSITSKRTMNVMTFMEGYYTSLVEIAQPPININELRTQVLSAGFQKMWNLLGLTV